MAIEGIDRLVFGVTDMAACARFFEDWGLLETSASPDARSFATLNGCEIVLRHASDPDLPPAIEEGPCVREVTWGVESGEDLPCLRAILQGREGFFDEPGSLGARDPNGLQIRFRVSTKRKVDAAPAEVNFWGQPNRVDQPAPFYERAAPIEVGHVVFFTPNLDAVSAFYEELGFRLSDQYPGRGRFLRCAERGGHHDLFLLQTPEGRRGINHVAFTVRDIHEVFGGGMHMSRMGWSTQLGPGRHPISSAYFWYFHNPAGGLIEYYTDEDYLTEGWEPRSFEPSPERFAEWAISGGIDGKTRRQAGTEASGKFLTE